MAGDDLICARCESDNNSLLQIAILTSQKHNPMEITKERYAKGKINKEEFEHIKKYVMSQYESQ